MKHMSMCSWLRAPAVATGMKVGAFLAAGLPAFAIAVPLNWFLVTQLDWYKPLAYALVLFCQVTINFFMCRWFVFTKRKTTPLRQQYIQFMTGICLFRLADWGFYSLLVTVWELHFIGVQLCVVVLFSLLKYKYSQRVLESKV